MRPGCFALGLLRLDRTARETAGRTAKPGPDGLCSSYGPELCQSQGFIGREVSYAVRPTSADDDAPKGSPAAEGPPPPAPPGLVPPPPPPHYPPGWVVRQLPRGKPAARAHVGFDLASGRVQTFRAAPGPKRGSARKRYPHGRRA